MEQLRKIYIMALIKLSAIGITALSGTSGGTTFAYSRSGKYMRNWAKPTNPQTAVQTQNRALFGFLSQAWGSLSQDEVAKWNEEAALQERTNRLGEQYKMNGFSYFKSVNQLLLSSGQESSFLTEPPEVLAAPDPIIDGFTIAVTGTGSQPIDTAQLDLAFPVAVDAGTLVASIQFVVQPIGKNIDYGTAKAIFGPKFYVPVPATAEGAGWAMASETELQTWIGNQIAGNKVFARVQIISNSGQTSVAVTTDTIVFDNTP